MKLPSPIHPWRLSIQRAVELQRQLRAKVQIERPRKPWRYVAGLDVAYVRARSAAVGAVVVWDRLEGRVIEEQVAVRRCHFPYVPGLLSFREAPALLAALGRVRRPPDVLLVDGHGVAHPRRFGVACHLGVWTDLPSVGCAKSVLVGRFDPPGPNRGDRSALMDGDERIGTVLRTRSRVRPVIVSVGHRTDLAAAEKLVLDCCCGFRLPEPARLAHQLVTRVVAGMP